MVLDVKSLLQFMKAHMDRYGTPVPITRDAAHGWAEELKLNKGGKIIVYTGLLYQLIPFIDATLKYLEMIEKVEQNKGILKLIFSFSKVNLSSIIKTYVPNEKIERQKVILKGIVQLLNKSGINDLGYLYDEDIYTGVLFYDFGFDEELVMIGKRISKSLKSNNVKKIITMDPHTTHMLRSVLPKYEESLKEFEVANYLELIKIREETVLKGFEFTIHDPCYYSRYENIRDQPRLLLRSLGIKVKETKRNKENTFCCGGPIESLTPSFSKKISELRLNELKNTSKFIITMCPICFSNLNRVNDGTAKIFDIAEVLMNNVKL